MHILVVWILTRSRNVEFQTLAVENLIIIESWRCLIKTYVLSRKCFIIVSSTFGGPLSSGVFEVILDFLVCRDHILDSLKRLLLNFESSVEFWCFLPGFNMTTLGWVFSKLLNLSVVDWKILLGLPRYLHANAPWGEQLAACRAIPWF